MPGLIPPPLPTAADAARDLLPGVKCAARERYGRVRMALISPFLPILIQLIAPFLLPWIQNWLASRGPTSPQMFALMRAWEDARPHEVSVAMARVAAGDVGED